MSEPFALDSFVGTHPGRERESNEDAVGEFTPLDLAVLAQRGALYVVADGMGGHAAGEVASDYAVQKILHTYYSLPWQGPEQTLIAALQEANADINAESSRSPERRGMGTTVVAAAVHEGYAVIAHVGDSRAYLLREGLLRPLTRDHSWVAEKLADGTITPEQAIDHPNRNVLTRNLGQRSYVEPDLITQDLVQGDRLLLCTDGLYNALRDEQEIAGHAQRGAAQQAGESLIAAANEAGGPDNIGVAVVGVGKVWRGATRRVDGLVSPTFLPSPYSRTRRVTGQHVQWSTARILLVAALIFGLMVGITGAILVRDAAKSTPKAQSSSQPTESAGRQGAATRQSGSSSLFGIRPPASVASPTADPSNVLTSPDIKPGSAASIAEPTLSSQPPRQGASGQGAVGIDSSTCLKQADVAPRGAKPYCPRPNDGPLAVAAACSTSGSLAEYYPKVKVLNPNLPDEPGKATFFVGSVLWIPDDNSTKSVCGGTGG